MANQSKRKRIKYFLFMALSSVSKTAAVIILYLWSNPVVSIFRFWVVKIFLSNLSRKDPLLLSTLAVISRSAKNCPSPRPTASAAF